MAELQISVIIPTYQRRESVKRVLKALEMQTIWPDLFEVLVVIDGSRDGTEDLIANTKTPYRLRAIRQPNRGRATACNTGIRGAGGELIVLLDDDMEPTPDFLTAHWQSHQSQKRLGVVGAAPVWVNPESSVNLYIAAKFKRHLEKLSQPGYQFVLRDFYSGNFSIRKKLLIEAGLFDEEFKLYGNEDLELSMRLRKEGISLIYCREALAYQHYEKDFTALAQDNIAKGKTAVLFVRKYPGIYAELKIGTYKEASKKWRMLRSGLLRLSRRCSGMPEYLIRFMTMLERMRPARLHLYYELALDYFFWLGVKNEQ